MTHALYLRDVTIAHVLWVVCATNIRLEHAWLDIVEITNLKGQMLKEKPLRRYRSFVMFTCKTRKFVFSFEYPP